MILQMPLWPTVQNTTSHGRSTYAFLQILHQTGEHLEPDPNHKTEIRHRISIMGRVQEALLKQ